MNGCWLVNELYCWVKLRSTLQNSTLREICSGGQQHSSLFSCYLSVKGDILQAAPVIIQSQEALGVNQTSIYKKATVCPSFRSSILCSLCTFGNNFWPKKCVPSKLNMSYQINSNLSHKEVDSLYMFQVSS